MKLNTFGLIWLFVCFKIINGKIRVKSHAYEGVVVSIGSHVKEDPLLIKRLQQYLTLTSRALFKATRNQLYFREIVIVIPETWRSERHYKTATDADIDHPQIIIDKPNPAYGEAPYVKQYAECGQPGLFIHLTPGYILDDSITARWGLPEKTLVHEWAHLRWGLFDEYPIDAQDRPFYRHAGRWEPVRCSKEVEGVLRNPYHKGRCNFNMHTGMPGQGCKFYPMMNYNPASSSVMFMQYLESITEFCDDPRTSHPAYRHNVYAPNRQNRLCRYRSAWQVMGKHEDFIKSGVRLPDYVNTTPRFKFVQVNAKRRVLVLDASGSMTGSSLHTLRQAASNFILTSVESGSWLGIVQFNTVASRLAPMTLINTNADRRKLINKLPYSAEGKTSIGAGLESGLKTLEDSESGSGGTIILITDGKENKSPWIKDMKPDIVKNNIMVHAFAYTQQAERSIGKLAGDTEGRSYFYNGQYNSTALINGLAATINGKPYGDVKVSVVTEAFTVRRGNPYTGSFTVDRSIGRDTTVTFVYTGDIDAIVVGPSTKLSKEDSDYLNNKTHGILTVTVPGVAEVGRWTYVVISHSVTSSLVVHVQSVRGNDRRDVISVRSWMSEVSVEYGSRRKISVFADVNQGMSPVLGAKVLGVMERPRADPLELPLLDDGIGADLFKDDGIYSSYILPNDLQGDGRYNLKVKVIGEDVSTKVIVEGHRSGAIGRGDSENIDAETKTESVGIFERVTSAGEFRLEGFPDVPEKTNDVIAPARIGDFVVTSFDQETQEAVLEWTSVGDDMGRGAAKGYKLHISTDISQFMQEDERSGNTTLYNGTLPEPQSVGLKETVNIFLHDLGDNDTIFLSIQAYDEANNHGDLSNVIPISYTYELAIPLSSEDDANHWLYIVGPLLAVVLVCISVLVFWRQYSKGDKGRGLFKGRSISESLSSITSRFPHMNYRVDGAYVNRSREDHSSWELH